MMYIPRGPIMDYGNSELVVFSSKNLSAGQRNIDAFCQSGSAGASRSI